MKIIQYVKVPVLSEDDPAAVLARKVIELLAADPRVGNQVQPLAAKSAHCYVTHCSANAYMSLDADAPNGLEFQCSIRMVNRVPRG